MGTGIAAAIPIVIGPNTRRWNKKLEREDFSANFFDGYTIADEEEQIYTVKEELLLSNYSSFLDEFYDCIGEKNPLETVPNITSYEEFEAAFDRKKRNSYPPHLDYDVHMFSIHGGMSSAYWLFYIGSYKALLESYITLQHFERTLTRALKNPLACMVKFGIFG